MASFEHARILQRSRLDLSFLAGGLRLPWVSGIFLIGFAIELLLAARLWLLLTKAEVGGPNSIVISLTNVLVAPFRDGDSLVGQRTSGAFEFSTLVAIEAYLIAVLALVLLIAALRFVVFSIGAAREAHRRHELRRRTAIKLKQAEPLPVPQQVSSPAIAAEPSEVGHP